VKAAGMGHKAAGMDYMAVGAHADDVELGALGTLLRLAALGRRGVIVDLTDASMGTRGTPAVRAREAAAAARALKAGRDNLGLPDGRLSDPALHAESEARLVAAIRRHRPRVILTHNLEETHPDHAAAARLVKRAAYLSGLAKLPLPGTPFRPARLFHFVGESLREPDFCVDISDHWKGKLKAVLCYRSQFHSPAASAGAAAAGIAGRAGRAAGKASGPGRGFGRGTDLSTPAFLENLEARNRYWGIRIKRRYAEAFVCEELPEIDDITALGGERFA